MEKSETLTAPNAGWMWSKRELSLLVGMQHGEANLEDSWQFLGKLNIPVANSPAIR